MIEWFVYFIAALLGVVVVQLFKVNYRLGRIETQLLQLNHQVSRLHRRVNNLLLQQK